MSTLTIHEAVAVFRALGATCEDALVWLAAQPDPETAWRACSRGLWLARVVILLDLWTPEAECIYSGATADAVRAAVPWERVEAVLRAWVVRIGCPTPGCPGPGPDLADRGPEDVEAVPIACPRCGVEP